MTVERAFLAQVSGCMTGGMNQVTPACPPLETGTFAMSDAPVTLTQKERTVMTDRPIDGRDAENYRIIREGARQRRELRAEVARLRGQVAAVEATLAKWPDGNERMSDYASARGQCKRAVLAALRGQQ